MNEQNPQGMQPLIPGESPVFKAGPGWGAKLKKNFTKIILPLIAIAVVAIGLVMILDRDGEEVGLTEPKTGTEEITEEGQTENIYKIAAQRGDGITHLARKTLKKYLNDNRSAGSGLTAEHIF